MKITWYGAASLLVRQGESAIAFDPFFGAPIGCFAKKASCSLPGDDFRAVTDVFVTHGHFDHLFHLPALSGMLPACIFHCTLAPRETLIRRGVDPKQIVPSAAGKTDRVFPFAVTAYAGRHCRFDLRLILKTVFRRTFFRHPVHLAHLVVQMLRFPEKGEILFYEVSCVGRRVQIMGSLGLDPDTDYPTGADVLILPFQGRSDLSRCALDVVRKLRPRFVLLDHYDDAFPPVSSDVDTQDFIKILAEQEHIACRTLIKGREFDVETEKTLGRP